MFDAALKRAVSDGDIIQVKDTYKLSPGCKNRREDDMEKKLSEQSESTRMECAEILFILMMKALLRRKLVGARLKLLPNEERVMGVTMQDKSCHEAMKVATHGAWEFFIVEAHRVDTIKDIGAHELAMTREMSKLIGSIVWMVRMCIGRLLRVWTYAGLALMKV